MMVQYYGEHVNGDGKLDSLPAMVDLVTTLSPHFTRAYLFGAFALDRRGRARTSRYELLQEGLQGEPGRLALPGLSRASSPTRTAQGKDKDLVAARWYQKAAAIPGSPDYLDAARRRPARQGRRAARRRSSCGVRRTWPATSTRARRRSTGLERILPEDKEARMKALAPLYGTMPKAEFDALIAELFKDYVQ